MPAMSTADRSAEAFAISTDAPVLVTGATGYVAGWIVKRLVQAGVTVRDPQDAK